MATNVFANHRAVCCKAASGSTLCAFPDVCMSPPITPVTPNGVPIPYPSTGMAADTSDGSTSVMIAGKPVFLQNASSFAKTTGDEPGSVANKGLVSGSNRGKAYFVMWSMDVQVEGKSVTRAFDLATSNHAGPMPGNTPPWPYIDGVA